MTVFPANPPSVKGWLVRTSVSGIVSRPRATVAGALAAAVVPGVDAPDAGAVAPEAGVTVVGGAVVVAGTDEHAAARRANTSAETKTRTTNDGTSGCV
jgi:hypothetical protein